MGGWEREKETSELGNLKKGESSIRDYERGTRIGAEEVRGLRKLLPVAIRVSSGNLEGVSVLWWETRAYDRSLKRGLITRK